MCRQFWENQQDLTSTCTVCPLWHAGSQSQMETIRMLLKKGCKSNAALILKYVERGKSEKLA